MFTGMGRIIDANDEIRGVWKKAMSARDKKLAPKTGHRRLK